MRRRGAIRAVLAVGGVVTLAACSATAERSVAEPTTTTTGAPATATLAVGSPAPLEPAAFGRYTVPVPNGWEATSTVGDPAAQTTWTDPQDPRYRISIVAGPGTNYWNHDLGRWRGDLPGFPEADANRVSPKYLQYPPLVVDGIATTRALMVNRDASQWVEVNADFPLAWQATADEIMGRVAGCVTGRDGC